MKCIIFAIALCTVVCSGCGPATPAQLRADHALHSQFEVDDSIQTVIKSISNKDNECRTGLPANIMFLEELSEAQIEYRLSFQQLIFLVDLKRQDDKTQVAIYSARSRLGWERPFRILELGAKNFPGCP